MPLKLQNPDWRFDPPSVLPDSAVDAFLDLALKTAAQGRVQDILEDFKGRLSTGTVSRSSTTSWAKSDLRNLMSEAANNAPLFIEGFFNACSDIKEQGYAVPSVNTINRVLTGTNAGYQIEGDTIVRKSWVPPQDEEDDEDEDSDDDESEPEEEVEDWVLDPSIDGWAVERFLIRESYPNRTTERPTKTDPVAPATTAPSVANEQVLRAFLCHSSADKGAVRSLYKKLTADGFKPWLDEEDLIPGQHWDAAIRRAVKETHVVIVCLSRKSITKAGYAQKEITFALDVADQQPEGTIFIIPARLEDCAVPDRLSKWHWVNLYDQDGYNKLLRALKARAADLK